MYQYGGEDKDKRERPFRCHTAFGAPNSPHTTTATTGAPMPSPILAIVPCPVWKPQYPSATRTPSSRKKANARFAFLIIMRTISKTPCFILSWPIQTSDKQLDK